MAKLTDDQKKAVLKVLQPQLNALTESIYAALEGLLPDAAQPATPVTDTKTLPFDTSVVSITGRNVTFPADARIAAVQVIVQLANGVSYNVEKTTVDPANSKQVIAQLDQDIANTASLLGKKATFKVNPALQPASTAPVIQPSTPVVTAPVVTVPATDVVSAAFMNAAGDFLNGVWVTSDAALISLAYSADLELAAVAGAVGTFNDKSTRTVQFAQVAADKSYINVKFDGGKLNAALGYPNKITFPKKGSKAPVQTPATDIAIDTTLNSRGGKKGEIYFNGGMGPGAPTYLPGRLGTNYDMISESEIKELVAMGVKEIRHGFLAARVIQPGGKSILYRGKNATGDLHQFEGMLQVGKWCKQYGLKIMWDMHNYGEFINNDNEAAATIYDLDQWVRDWTAIIVALKADADTWFATARFDTMNEWKAQFSAAQLAAAFQKLLNAVGVLSGDKVFVFEGTYWSSCINWVSNVGKEYATLKHPVDNKYIEFSAHLYLNQSAGGMYGEGDTLNPQENVTFDNIGLVRIASFAKWLKQYGFAGNIGECMVPGDCPQLMQGQRNLMLFCIANGINMYLFCWSGWAANSVHDLKSTRNAPMLNLAKEMLALK